MKQDIVLVCYNHYIIFIKEKLLFLFCLGDCLQLLTTNNTNYNDPKIKPIIDEHLARFAILSNQTAVSNKYISMNILMMIPQVYGIIYYKNGSFQECLSVLYEASQREFELVIDNNSPILIFALSSNFLAMHLLLIHRYYQEPTVNWNFDILIFETIIFCFVFY